jgi:hypothetical protein
VFGDNLSNIDIQEFLCNIFYEENKKPIKRQKKIRTWVDKDGIEEFNFQKENYRKKGRIMTMKSVLFLLNLNQNLKSPLMRVRCSKDSHFVLSTPNFSEFEKIINIAIKETITDFNKYNIQQIFEKKENKNKFGELFKFVDYYGTNDIEISIPKSTPNWYPIFKDIFTDIEYLYNNEQMVPIILYSQENPCLQIQIIDYETKSVSNVLGLKNESKIIISPEENYVHVKSILKILDVLQTSFGSIFEVN